MMKGTDMELYDKYGQFSKLVSRCYDDYCYYNRMDKEKREQFVDSRELEFIEDGRVIPYLPVYLTTRCTLNCAKCNNLMPLFKESAGDFSFEKTKEALDNILSVVKEIIFLELVGGEPFLNEKFEEMLDYLANEKKIRQIIVVTNATVIPNDNIIKKLSDSKVIVRISDYGMFDVMSRFVSKLDKASVNMRVQQDMKWNDPGDITRRGKTLEEIKIQYNRCEFSMKCKYLCESRLFTCARAASLYKLGILESDQDSIEITNDITWNELLKFYVRDYAEACDYCDLWSENNTGIIPAAEQVGGGKIRHSDYTIISNYELNHFKSSTKKYEQLIRDKHLSEMKGN